MRGPYRLGSIGPQGYTVAIDYSISLDPGFQAVTATSAPGLFQAALVSNFDATIRNTTSGRDVALGFIHATPVALYSLDQPACAGGDQSDPTLNVNSDSYRRGEGRWIGVIGGHCVVPLDSSVGSTTSLTNPVIPAGGSLPIGANSNLASVAKIGGLAESHMESIIAGLNDPVAIFMMTFYEDSRSEWHAEGACQTVITGLSGIGTREIEVVPSDQFPDACSLL